VSPFKGSINELLNVFKPQFWNLRFVKCVFFKLEKRNVDGRHLIICVAKIRLSLNEYAKPCASYITCYQLVRASKLKAHWKPMEIWRMLMLNERVKPKEINKLFHQIKVKIFNKYTIYYIFKYVKRDNIHSKSQTLIKVVNAKFHIEDIRKSCIISTLFF
jgi:hypothetical protein